MLWCNVETDLLKTHFKMSFNLTHFPFCYKNFINLRYFSNLQIRCIQSAVVEIKTAAKNGAENKKTKLHELIEKYEDKIIYNTVIEQQKLKLGYKQNKVVENKISKQYKKLDMKLRAVEPLPISLKFIHKGSFQCNQPTIAEKTTEKELLTQFPFETTDKIIKSSNSEGIELDYCQVSTEKEISVRQENYEEVGNKNWMTDYENYDDSEVDDNWQSNYGTPDPSSTPSNVPCGGCGAFLHCKDTSIPGYIPSEIFHGHRLKGGQNLKSVICQRCHFLKHYDIALQVRVLAEEYPKMLMSIRNNKNALAILIIDLLDFPCSIWPHITDIIGYKRPVFLVGNKVDLLPKDSKGYLHRIKNILIDTANKSGLSQADIQHVFLISAKTGYGIEELITTLHSSWAYKGDVYLIGCTNVGKSTLFNTLLQSDFCKIKAVDLVQRATTSLWPGTTLNLLKFPILRPSGWRMYVRNKRLISLNKLRSQEERLRKIQLRDTQNPKYATLIGHIERTFTAEEPVTESKDIFAVAGHENASGKAKIGINEKDPEFKLSKWCFDTPGVVHPAQILHLLTTDELMLMLPKQLIQPRVFSLKPGSTLFLAGLGRLDFIDGPKSMRFTVFASDNLPITICETSQACELYKELIGTEIFFVPKGNEERLLKWPSLEAEEFKLIGKDWQTSCADIVLSNAGWISVTCGSDISCSLKAWTPEKRGLYVRDSILPKAVGLRGRRIRFSPAYKKCKFYTE